MLVSATYEWDMYINIFIFIVYSRIGKYYVFIFELSEQCRWNEMLQGSQETLW